MEFEFGETTQSAKFFKDHSTFPSMFQHLIEITNKVFGRSYTPKSRLEDIGFNLGETCRTDYLDIVFLCINGHKKAATKILRGLYERSLALAYMLNDPPKAERFVRYAAIQEHRMMQAALRVVPEEQFNRAMAPKQDAETIRQFYRQIKPEFEITDCKTCKTKKIQTTWDIDVASMATKVGHPFDHLFLLAYTIPTGSIHATLASAYESEDVDESDTNLIVATELFIQALWSQDSLFTLGLSAELESLKSEIYRVWPEIVADQEV